MYSYYSFSTIKVTNSYADLFSENLIEVVNQKEEFNMTDITDFKWDKMVVFHPYTSREEMKQTVGHGWTTYSYIGYYLIQRTVLGNHPLDDDSLNKVIFIKGDKVVLDLTFNRGKVDFTQINQTINQDEAQFYVQDKMLKQHEK